MPRATAPGGIELEYETFGSPSDPALLLVMGFTAQMISWDERFCRELAEHGRFVIRFDNRDCGLSSKHDGVEVDMGEVLTCLAAGDPGDLWKRVPYTLSDMADDAFAVLDALGIERAHIVGASMGGMIVQTMALEHPERVLTMTSIMSTTGEIAYGASTPEASAALLTPPPADRAGYVESAGQWAVFSSPRYFDLEQAKARAGVAYDRAFYPEGAARQLAAIVASGSRGDRLPALTVPTLVIHGAADTLITPSGGERTAELVPGAELLMLADMGHDLPEPLWPEIVGAIVKHTDR